MVAFKHFKYIQKIIIITAFIRKRCIKVTTIKTNCKNDLICSFFYTSQFLSSCIQLQHSMTSKLTPFLVMWFLHYLQALLAAQHCPAQPFNSSVPSFTHRENCINEGLSLPVLPSLIQSTQSRRTAQGSGHGPSTSSMAYTHSHTHTHMQTHTTFINVYKALFVNEDEISQMESGKYSVQKQIIWESEKSLEITKPNTSNKVHQPESCSLRVLSINLMVLLEEKKGRKLVPLI